jgi:nucleoside-diphosphate-sugar epimerase
MSQGRQGDLNVLVVGGAGYIGGSVTDILMQSEHQVRVYDALLYEESYRKPVEFVYGDVRESNKLLPHLKWADAVIWLAALVGDGACALNPEVTGAINQDSVRWLAQNYAGRIIFTSTC